MAGTKIVLHFLPNYNKIYSSFLWLDEHCCNAAPVHLSNVHLNCIHSTIYLRGVCAFIGVMYQPKFFCTCGSFMRV